MPLISLFTHDRGRRARVVSRVAVGCWLHLHRRFDLGSATESSAEGKSEGWGSQLHQDPEWFSPECPDETRPATKGPLRWITGTWTARNCQMPDSAESQRRRSVTLHQNA